MKHIKPTSVISLFTIAFLTVVTSCKKTELIPQPTQNSVSGDVNSIINSMHNNFLSHSGSGSSPNTRVCKLCMCAADAGGGMTGGELGGMFGPWGALAGGLIGAGIASGCYLYGVTVQPPTNPQSLYPTDVVGIYHNSALAYIGNHQSFFNGSGEIRTDSVYNYFTRVLDTTSAFNSIEMRDIFDTWSEFDSTARVKEWNSTTPPSFQDQLDTLYSNNDISEDVYDILSSFATDAFRLERHEDFLDYVENAQHEVNGSTALSTDDKRLIMIVLSIAKYSEAFWDANS